MFHHYAKFVARFRWLIVIMWVVMTVGATIGLPSLSNVVAHKQTPMLPTSTPVIQAGNLLNQVNPSHSASTSAIVAIHRSGGLTEADINYLSTNLSKIENNQTTYGVKNVEDAFNVDQRAASSFISKDKTTEIAVVGFTAQPSSDALTTSLNKLHQLFSSTPAGASVFFTGDAPIQQDDVTVSENGAKKTAGVTVALVLVILLIVFRSVVAPLITLISIGVSFLLSSSLVAWLAEHGLPVSTFTQTFLIAILFGAGTDYSIIMMNRYREEMTKDHPDKIHALAAALQGISKTVVFSGLTVLISFAVLFFAHFGIYRSAVGVAVGVFVALLACLTLIPALMDILGAKLFWPRKPIVGAAHKPSRIWLTTGGLSIRRPWWTLIVLLIALLPVGLLFTNDRTFDPMSDIPSAPSVQGFHTVANAFGQGRVMPMDIVIHTSTNLRTSAGLTTINNISNAVAGVSGVAEVDSATRPQGTVISGFQIASQNQQAADGLGKVQNGLTTLGKNLGSSSTAVQSGAQGATALVNGSQQVTAGATKLQSSLNTYAASVQQVQDGAAKVANGVSQSAIAANQLASGTSKLSASQQKISNAAASLANALAAWAKAHPGATANPAWQQIQQLATATANGTAQTSAASTQLNQGTQALAHALPSLATGAAQVSQATNQLTNGATRIASGSQQLVNGSKQVTQGIQTVTGSLGKLSGGLQEASSAMAKLNDGVGQVSSYLSGSKDAIRHGNPGFYVPSDTVSTNTDLQTAMNAYISPDGHVAQITVILSDNPYSTAAIANVPNIEHAAQVAFNASPIHVGTIQSAGTTPVQYALNQISNQDFVSTMALILITIFILLVLMLRSVIAPIYIIVSLTATYFVTMGLLQVIAIHVLHKPGLSWAVPFFVFLLLVALGVDYAIFLMSRFDEEHKHGHSTKQAMLHAMGKMGNVIFSAAVIMAGTFGSMAVAGVTSLVEIGIAIIIGLLVYTTVLLGFFVPACASVVAGGHHWPFLRESKASKGNDGAHAFAPRQQT